MKLLTVEEISFRLKDRKLKAVAAACGLSYGQVRNYARGDVRRPSHQAMVTLSQYLTQHD